MADPQDAAALLLALLKDVDIHGFERSVKVFGGGTALWNRFLVGVRKGSMGPQGGDAAVVDMCRRMGMPADLADPFIEKLPEVNFVLFGFEQNERTSVYKVYLEYYDTFGSPVEARPSPRGPLVMHLGFKWDVFDSRRIAMTEYVWHPMLPAREVIAQMADIYKRASCESSLEIVEAIFRVAAGRMSRNDILYLDVTEGANLRRSFDVNLYAANLTMGDLAPHLTRLCDHYDIDPDSFLPACRQLGDRALGHLAGGIDRQGRDFVTVYYEDRLPAS